MKKKLLFTAMLGACVAASAEAQSTTPEVIATQGDYFTSAGGTISWTLGEISTETYSAGGNVVTQGFQQPSLLLTTGIKSAESSLISVYPNPVVTDLTINFGNSQQGKYVVGIFDLQGKMLSSENVEVTNGMLAMHTFSFGNYAPGIYLLRVSGIENGSQELFRIDKP